MSLGDFHRSFFLTLWLENVGKVSAQSVMVKLYIPVEFQYHLRGWKGFTATTYEGFRVNPFQIVVGLSNEPPVYPGLRMQISGDLTPNKLFIKNLQDFEAESANKRFERYIFYEISRMDMAPKKGRFILDFNNTFVSTRHEPT